VITITFSEAIISKLEHKLTIKASKAFEYDYELTSLWLSDFFKACAPCFVNFVKQKQGHLNKPAVWKMPEHAPLCTWKACCTDGGAGSLTLYPWGMKMGEPAAFFAPTELLPVRANTHPHHARFPRRTKKGCTHPDDAILLRFWAFDVSFQAKGVEL
jgi:hypothetical protein